MTHDLEELRREVVTTRWLLRRAVTEPVLALEHGLVRQDIGLVDRVHMHRIEQIIERLISEDERAGPGA